MLAATIFGNIGMRGGGQVSAGTGLSISNSMIGLIIKCVNYFQIRQSFDYSRPRGNQVVRPDVTPAAVHEFRHQSCYLYHNERSVSYMNNRLLDFFVIDKRDTEL